MGKRIQILYITVIWIMALSGCVSNETYCNTEQRYVVGVVAKSSSSEYWRTVYSGMEAAAEEYGMELIFLAPDSELKKEVQNRMVEDLIERHVDAIAISPIDSYDTPHYMEKIKALGIPTVAFDTGFQEQGIYYVGIDNEQIGYELAEILANQIEHRGEVGIVSGSLEQMGHKERVEGFQRYMASEKNITVSFIESGYSNLQMSEKKVRALLEEYPHVKGIFATSAVTALGLSSATESQEIKIVAIDEQKDALEALEREELSALALQSGYEIGYRTICFIEDIRNGKENIEDDILETEIVTKEMMVGGKYETEKYSN